MPATPLAPVVRPGPTAPPEPETRTVAVALLVLGLLTLHVSLAGYLELPLLRLLEIAFRYGLVLFPAAFLATGLRRPLPMAVRAGVPTAYVGTMLALVFLPYPVTRILFDELLRALPIPFAVAAFGNAKRTWGPSQWVGVSLLLFPLWRPLFNSFPDLIVIAQGGATLGPTPASEFYQSFFLKFLWDVLYPLLGLLFVFERVPWIHQAPRWGSELERLLRPLEAWTKRRVPLDAAWGAILFVALVAGNLLLASALANSPTGDVGDDSRVFDLITLDLVFLLALIAGVGEELVYRGVLQTSLHRLFGPGRLALASAILGQALVFAVVHAGYASLNHLILPFLFGLFAGIVFRLFGILAAILVHVQIDVLAFGFEYAQIQNAADGTAIVGRPEMLFFLGFLLLANLAYGTIYLLLELVHWVERRQIDAALAAS